MGKGTVKDRYFFIELLAWWEGSIGYKQLMAQFGITRQQASEDLKIYNKNYSENLYHVTKPSIYKPTQDFSPKFISDDVNQYLHWFLYGELKRQLLVNASGVCKLALPIRDVSPEVIRKLVVGIREKKRLEVDYVSLSNPETDGRIFHPQTFVNAGLRWHVRGYCEKAQDYRDLVLSRFRNDAEILGDSDKDIKEDSAWQTSLEIILQPDPRLSPAKQEVLANDYQMKNGQLIIHTRAALANYLLHELQVNIKMLDGTPEAQQLVLVNRDDVKPWLFSG